MVARNGSVTAAMSAGVWISAGFSAAALLGLALLRTRPPTPVPVDADVEIEAV
ncbi:hypothetical protein [Nocardia bovistercoris]|uniref:Uncharacterized protein n=1 Tax=Nocardia bovistercoris TaxID=2785916 RepID=A0A931N5G6_9NOCA|nr:hypothetical protein [Nocardia bovistercoris]MBH0779824.1 hypothetical protein [Nocardia bovistercoris]